MFMGITSHQNAKPVRCYADAEAALERASKTPTGKRRTEKPDGFHLGLGRNHGVTWVKRHADGTIAFKLYDTEVVIWHPDNSFEIDNFGSVTTSGFASRFTPEGIHLRYPVERRGSCGGDRGITYQPVGGDDWRTRWRHARICFGGLPRFRATAEGGWAPDEDTLDKIVFPELNMARARDMSKALHFREFETWLAVAPHHLELEHEGFDATACESALEKRDYRQAACLLPLLQRDSFGQCRDAHALPIYVRDRDYYVGLGSIGKLKLALWEENGHLSDLIVKTIGLDDFNRRMARVRALDALGFEGTYGPRF